MRPKLISLTLIIGLIVFGVVFVNLEGIKDQLVRVIVNSQRLSAQVGELGGEGSTPTPEPIPERTPEPTPTPESVQTITSGGGDGTTAAPKVKSTPQPIILTDLAISDIILETSAIANQKVISVILKQNGPGDIHQSQKIEVKLYQDTISNENLIGEKTLVYNSDYSNLWNYKPETNYTLFFPWTPKTSGSISLVGIVNSQGLTEAGAKDTNELNNTLKKEFSVDLVESSKSQTDKISKIGIPQITEETPYMTQMITEQGVFYKRADDPNNQQTLQSRGYLVELKEPALTEKKLETEKQESDPALSWATFDIPYILKNHENTLNQEHSDFKFKLRQILGRDPKVLGETKNVLNMIALDITEIEKEAIKTLPEVKRISPNYLVYTTLMDSVPLINADDVWELKDEQERYNITGQGVKIAIIDTGVDYTHPDLGGCLGFACKVIGGYDFVNDNDPMDDVGHGTHVAGIAAGKANASSGLNGVAPDAKILAYKVLNSSGSGTFEDVIEGIEKAVLDGADVINLSLGADCGIYSVNCGPDDLVSQAVDNATYNNVSVIVAAGNSGSSEQTIGSPGTARKAITIGATYKKDYEGQYWQDNNPRIDQITSFSSNGPVIWEDSSSTQKAILKPDIVAPGAIICASRYDEIFPEGNHEYYYPCLDEEHVQLAGTSMAAPHVAGAAALIKQLHPN